MSMFTTRRLTCYLIAVVVVVLSSPAFEIDAFTVPSRSFLTTPRRHHHPRSPSSLYFFRKKQAEKDEDSSSNGPSDEEVKEASEESSGKKPFFARFGLGGSITTDQAKEKQPVEDTNKDESLASSVSSSDSSSSTTTTTTTAMERPTPTVAPIQNKPAVSSSSSSSSSPEEQAAKFRAEAERVRLEAERMDAELTLRKIEKLEKELAHARAKADGEVVEDLMQQMEALQKKLRGESTDTKKPSTSMSSSSSSASLGSPSVFSPRPENTFSVDEELGSIVATKPVEDDDDVKKAAELLQAAPGVLRKSVAVLFGYDFDTVEDINATELVQRARQMQQRDYSYTGKPPPRFTSSQIRETEKQIEGDRVEVMDLFAEMEIPKEILANNTKLALLLLEQQYYMTEELDLVFSPDKIEKIFEGEEWLKPVVDAINKSDEDMSFEQFFPKCTRKEGQEPTLAQVQQLATDVLPNAGFKATSKPEPVSGGYIIRGSSKAQDGDALITAIDEQMAKLPSLNSSLTVLYTEDFTVLFDMPFEEVDPRQLPTMLYILGADVVRSPRRVELSIASALGIATSWYLSIYPFLLNPSIAKRVEEDLALADANMIPDLSWLTDQTIPLFLTFIGLQLVHELSHQVVAGLKGVKLTAPTFVPSIITGITSSVTTFKTLPANKNSMFDIAAAGPFAGVLVSVLAIFGGSLLTASSDPSMLPALPLEILRQSTLGGGIINYVLGNGILSAPEGALGTQALAGITIPLHPIAVAGYISLIVNALALLPVGTTDGGRIALTIFGRGPKLLISNIFLLTLLSVGFLGGSDLFLFYFAFVVAFQSGNEVPCRNEVDKTGFGRILAAIAAYVVGTLSLAPFQ